MVGEKHQKRVEVEGPRAKALLVARQRHLADLHLAARAPRQHGRGAGRGEPVDRRVADPRGVGEIAFAELVDAAALAGPAHDLVVDTETVERVEAEKCDVRGLQDIAAGVEHDIGRALARRLRLASDAGQGLGRQLQPRQDAHAAAHRLKALPPTRVERLVAGLRAGEAARQLHHKARIDAFGAGRNAVAAAAAHRGPANRLRIAAAAGDQIDDAGRGFRRIRVAEPGRSGHRAGPKAGAAARAGIGDRLAPRPEILEIPGRFGAVVHAVTKIVLGAEVTAGCRRSKAEPDVQA